MLNPKEFIEDAIIKIKDEIGDEKTIIALSGGVDSSVCSVLTQEAIGDNLTAIFVNHGLLREGEAEQVCAVFEERLNFKYVDAVDAKYLVQGTIAPDWIETEGEIKTHHNMALPSGMVLKVVEPVRDLYKDEVREVGTELGLPDSIVQRQPFPGPGLGVRVVGALTRDNLAVCRAADAIVREEVEKAGLDKELWQYFAVLTDTKVTGVKGDERDFGYLIVIRLISSVDAMTATVPEMPWDVIRTISRRITSEVSEVTHVALSISDKPPSTIEFC